ncbi:hypothetical protein [Chondromyces crocatus]|uniref:hypothetical protein n=1 Tax=Chondromyces crocatus TaxID=52 RepID=UPI0012E270D5|nr:hypothetical protein [Chondromyces crocatus]
MGPSGTGPAGPPGPQGPAGPPGTGAHTEDEWGFAGFTVATYTGNLGGRIAAHALCAAEFSGAHFCHASEYVLSVSMTPVPPDGAWIDPSATPDASTVLSGSPQFGRSNAASSVCGSWESSATNTNGYIVQPSGIPVLISSCAQARPLACCNGASMSAFAGVTSDSYAGNHGGRVAAHSRCNAEYPGAHLCHAAEYLRTSSSHTIPQEGAWLDPSTNITGGLSLNGVPTYGRSSSLAATCNGGATAASNSNGTSVNAAGIIASTSSCAIARPFACCF